MFVLAAPREDPIDMFLTNILLSNYSSYKIGGPADYFLEPKTVEELTAAVAEAERMHLPVFILGGGTNVLFSDVGFRGLVLKPAIGGFSIHDAAVTVGGGVSMADLLTYAIQQSLTGLEWAGGLPGTVGGAVRGNAGAFGGEIKDSVLEVQSLVIGDGEPRFMRRTNAECHFGYRASIFKELNGKEIILSAVFILAPGDPEVIRRATEEKIRYRRERHPLEYSNVGSIFKNVLVGLFTPELRAKLVAVTKDDPFPVVPTAYLISEAGLKGTRVGGAEVSEKHPNFIVNVGGATAADVEALIKIVKVKVKEKFGIMLEEEIMLVGEFHENR